MSTSGRIVALFWGQSIERHVQMYHGRERHRERRHTFGAIPAFLYKNFTEHELDTLWCLLKKVYSFDGEEHDGFEEDASGRLEGDYSNLQLRVLEEFRRRRNGQK